MIYLIKVNKSLIFVDDLAAKSFKKLVTLSPHEVIRGKGKSGESRKSEGIREMKRKGKARGKRKGKGKGK